MVIRAESRQCSDNKNIYALTVKCNKPLWSWPDTVSIMKITTFHMLTNVDGNPEVLTRCQQTQLKTSLHVTQTEGLFFFYQLKRAFCLLSNRIKEGN